VKQDLVTLVVIMILKDTATFQVLFIVSLFICRCCKVDRPITDGLNTDLHLDIGNGVSLEKVDKFCYLGYVGCRQRM